MHNLLTQDEWRLFRLLDKSRDSRYYSYSLESVCDTLNCDRNSIIKLGRGIENKLGTDYHVNIFEWSSSNGVNYTFTGFEYRRKDYERDSRNGINIVEQHIKNGVY